MIAYQIIRSNRKTVCIQLTREGEVLVRAPRRCARSYIDQFVRSKASWIASHQVRLREQRAQADAFVLQDGQRLSYCGKDIWVTVLPEHRPELVDNRLILPTGDMDTVREPLRRLTWAAGLPWLRERLAGWEATMGIDCAQLKMSAARQRWGSCTQGGVIRISGYLLFAPQEAVDYVLIHELAHRRHFDHSRAFWQLVQEYCPDYQAQRRALLQYQQEPFLQSLAK